MEIHFSKWETFSSTFLQNAETDVQMIDFAHVFLSNTKDQGYVDDRKHSSVILGNMLDNSTDGCFHFKRIGSVILKSQKVGYVKVLYLILCDTLLILLKK